jgi:hypothetical protein
MNKITSYLMDTRNLSRFTIKAVLYSALVTVAVLLKITAVAVRDPKEHTTKDMLLFGAICVLTREIFFSNWAERIRTWRSK